MKGSDRPMIRAIRGPVTLITIGALFALNNAHAYGRLKYLLNSDNRNFFARRIRGMVRYTDLTRARIRFPNSYRPKSRVD
jgi:hypothetical protein